MPFLRVPWESQIIDLDQWAIRVVQSNCDMEKGAPYWIEFQRKNNLNLVREIQTWRDLLEKLPNQPEGALQPEFDGAKFTHKPSSFLLTPKHLLNEKTKLHHSRSSGSTKLPKEIFWSTDSLDFSIRACSYYLDKIGVKKNVNWLITGPPTIYKEYMFRLVRFHGGLPLFVQMPTEGIKPLFETSEEKLTEGQKYYKKRIIEEFTREVKKNLADSHLEISVIVGLPFGLNLLSGSDLEGIDNVLFLGAGVTPEIFSQFKENFSGKTVKGFYTHFMNGPARLVENGNHLNYYSTEPLVHFDVKNPETGEKVEHGEPGRIEFLRAGEDILWKQWEDGADRIPACEIFPWDGVRNIRRYVPEVLK